MLALHSSSTKTHALRLAFVALSLLAIRFISTLTLIRRRNVEIARERTTIESQKTILPSPPTLLIPKKHWQTYKVFIDWTPDDETAIGRQSSAAIFHAIQSWRKVNPEHRYELIADSNADHFVEESLPDKPEVIEAFKSVTDGIIKADFIRYLILFAHGGVYSDIDTVALKPVSIWIPAQHKDKVNFVVGVEIDEPNVMWADWADNFVFCQSTMMAKPNHGIYRRVISNIVDTLQHQAKEQNSSISDLKFNFQDVLRTTGPVAFSHAVFSYLSEETNEEITRANFTSLAEPKLVADVLVLPTVAFVPGSQHSHAGSIEDAGALVQHLGMGSWTSTHQIEGL